jgi:hypothetical protein
MFPSMAFPYFSRSHPLRYRMPSPKNTTVHNMNIASLISGSLTVDQLTLNGIKES